jgi:hypothetical protein
MRSIGGQYVWNILVDSSVGCVFRRQLGASALHRLRCQGTVTSKTLFRYRESLVVLQRAKCNPGPELGSVFISSRYANSVVSTVTFGRCGQREAVTAPDPRSGEDTFDLIDDAVAALADRRLVWLGDDLRTIALLPASSSKPEDACPNWCTTRPPMVEAGPRLPEHSVLTPTRLACDLTRSLQSPTADGTTITDPRQSGSAKCFEWQFPSGTASNRPKSELPSLLGQPISYWYAAQGHTRRHR